MRTGIIQDTIVRPALAAALVLAIPLLAMAFADGVDWSVFDFIVLGGLVFGVGLVYELVTKRVRGRARLVAGGVLLVVILLTWVELAVGLFGTPLAGD